MKDETFHFSPSYAMTRVKIHGEEKIDCNNRGGGIFCFLHFGSFFLSGGAISKHMNLNYTAVASTSNHEFLAKEEKFFWKGVFSRAEKMYSRKLFFTDENPKHFIDWVMNGNYLGVAIDVIEAKKKNKLKEYVFLGSKILLQTSAARLSRITKKPMIPMTIRHCPWRNSHDLFLGDPIFVDDIDTAMERALLEFEDKTKDFRYQYFHNLPLLYCPNYAKV